MHDIKVEEESIIRDIDNKEVPELMDSPPPSINIVLPSPIRSGLKIKKEQTTPTSTECLSHEVSKQDVNVFSTLEETDTSPELGGKDESENERTSQKQEGMDSMEVEESRQESEHLQTSESAESHLQEDDAGDINLDNVEEMTVIDEVTEEEKNDETSESISRQTGAESGDMVIITFIILM